jgi:hypothetical protein
MIAVTLLHCCFRTREVRRSLFRLASLLAPMAALAACRDGGVLEPTSAAVPTALRHSAVIVTADYSMFSTRPELNGAGTVDYFNSFDELSGQLVYMQPTPWTTNGVTYTSALNIVLGAGVGMGVASNAVSTEFGAPLVAQLAAADAFTLFGVDVTLIGEKVPVSLVVATNLGSYAFTNLDIPLATTGRRFIGVALSRPGEYLTGFRFTIQTANATVLLDNVAVGHVGVVGPNNADPEATVGGAYDALEGSEVTFAMSGTDPDGDALHGRDPAGGPRVRRQRLVRHHPYRRGWARRCGYRTDDGHDRECGARTECVLCAEHRRWADVLGRRGAGVLDVHGPRDARHTHRDARLRCCGYDGRAGRRRAGSRYRQRHLFVLHRWCVRRSTHRAGR